MKLRKKLTAVSVEPFKNSFSLNEIGHETKDPGN